MASRDLCSSITTRAGIRRRKERRSTRSSPASARIRAQASEGFIRHVLFQKPQPEDFIQKLIQAANRVPTDSAIADLTAMYAADYNAVLPKIDRPVIVCASSGGFAAARIASMSKKIPHAQLEMFEGDGHALFVDDPDKFNALIEDFASDFQ